MEHFPRTNLPKDNVLPFSKAPSPIAFVFFLPLIVSGMLAVGVHSVIKHNCISELETLSPICWSWITFAKARIKAQTSLVEW